MNIPEISKEFGIVGVIVGGLIVAGVVAYNIMKEKVILTITGTDASNPLNVKLSIIINNVSKKKVKYLVYHVEIDNYSSKKYTFSHIEPMSVNPLTISLDNPSPDVGTSFDLESAKLKVDKIEYY